jgi:hypothetical protein
MVESDEKRRARGRRTIRMEWNEINSLRKSHIARYL